MTSVLYVFFLLFFIPSFSFAQTIPAGVAITPEQILEFMQSIAGFLMIIGGILASITIVVTGIMYMSAGSNTQKVTDAKGMFKAGIIGALIVFATGIIINTIVGFGANPLGFFG